MATKFSRIIKHSRYICDFYKKELFSYLDCSKCIQKHHEFSENIVCEEIRLRTNPERNVALPKNYKFKPVNFAGKRILIERTDRGLGDLLTITIAIRELKKNFPSAHVVFRVPSYYKPILENNPYIDGIIGLNEDIKKDIFIPYSNPCPAGVYEHTHNRNIFRSRIDVFCEYLGFSPTDKTPVFCLTNKEKKEGQEFFRKRGLSDKKKIGIALAAGEIWVNWTRKGNLELIKLLIKKGYVPVIFTMESQEPMNIKGAIDIHGESIRCSASIFNYCNIAITQDGGMLHMAAALGIPQICLLGPTDPKYRVAMYKGGHWIVKHEEICPLGYDNDAFCWYYPLCSVDKQHPDGKTDIIPPCLMAIEAKEVFKKIEEILNG